MRPGQIRPLALGIFWRGRQILVFEGHDPTTGKTFYRPLGGAIEFGEHGQETVVREMREELQLEVTNLQYLGLSQNIYFYDDRPGHEIVLLYQGELADPAIYEQETMTGYEDDGSPIRVMWKPVDLFLSGQAPLYPDGLLDLLECGARDDRAHLSSGAVPLKAGQPPVTATVGSANPVKIAATRGILWRLYGKDTLVQTIEVESGVSLQPWGNQEAAQGAINRALAARQRTGTSLGIGFEGALLEVAGQVFTCAWCAVAGDGETIGIAGGESVLLPPSVAEAVRAGAELGPAMDALTGRHNTKQNDGAIGILTAGWLDRQAAYEHLLIMALARMLTPVYYGGSVPRPD